MRQIMHGVPFHQMKNNTGTDFKATEYMAITLVPMDEI